MAFKKVAPKVHLSGTGGSFGFGVETIENINGKEVVVTKSSKDVYPEQSNPEMFSLENQLRAGVNLKEVNVGTVVSDIDRQDEQLNKLTDEKIKQFEESFNKPNE